MIFVTKSDGDQILLNDDQIQWIEVLHDTIIVLQSGERLRVLETGEEIKARIVHWRRNLLGLSFFSAEEIDTGE